MLIQLMNKKSHINQLKKYEWFIIIIIIWGGRPSKCPFLFFSFLFFIIFLRVNLSFHNNRVLEK
jgi:hypothetical protein